MLVKPVHLVAILENNAGSYFQLYPSPKDILDYPVHSTLQQQFEEGQHLGVTWLH